MKAVLGFLFLLSGFTVGYLVLSGKLPNAIAATANVPVVPGQKGDKSVGKETTSTPAPSPLTLTGLPGNIGGGPMNTGMLGIPAFAYGMDMPASRGMS